MKNLSLHSKKSHKLYLDVEKELPFLESILDMEMYEHDISSNSELILFDMDQKEIIKQSENLEDLCFDEFSPETITVKDLHPDMLSELEIPDSIDSLSIDGGQYLSEILKKSDSLLKIWESYISLVQQAKFTADLQERLKNESKIRSLLKNVEELDFESPIFGFLTKISDLKIRGLALRWIYLSQKDVGLLSNLNNIEILEFRYNYNDSFLGSKLPANLKELIIFGTTIECLSQINWEGLRLKTLDLESNTIKDLSKLKDLPDSLEDLVLDRNCIKSFSIKDLPENLEMLSLKNNQIDNTFFEGANSSTVNSKIKYLDISGNELTVNNWLLHRILETFPALEYLDLAGNKISDIPEELLINSEESSCIANIEYWLGLFDYKSVDILYSELQSSFNCYDKKNSLIIRWQHDLLPSKLILSDVQQDFEKYLGRMPKFKAFKEGLYCDIEHNNLSVIIREDQEFPNSIIMELYASDKKDFSIYFYKYFAKIKSLVELNTHHCILPFASFSSGCGVYEDFFKYIYRIDGKIKRNLIVSSNEKGAELLVDIDKDSKKTQYVSISSVAFILKAGNNFYPFILDENDFLYNYSSYSNECFKIYLKDTEKKMYSESLTNKYLGDFRLAEGSLQAVWNVGQNNTVYYNPKYFVEKEGKKLIATDPKINLDKKKLADLVNSGRKLEISINNNAISLEKWI